MTVWYNSDDVGGTVVEYHSFSLAFHYTNDNNSLSNCSSGSDDNLEWIVIGAEYSIAEGNSFIDTMGCVLVLVHAFTCCYECYL